MTRIARFWATFALGIASAAVVSCAHGRPSEAEKPKAASAVHVPPPELAGFAREAELAGASPLEVLASGGGIPGDSLSAFVSVPAGRCAVLAARGAQGVTDLDLYLFGDDGDELATEDDRLSPATLIYCAKDAPVRVFALSRIAAGRGAFSLGLADAPGGREATLRARLLTPPRPALARPSDFPGVDAELGDHRSLLGGTWRDVRRVLVPVDHRLPTQVDVALDADRCVDAFLMTDEDVVDLDVEALSRTGRVLARAETLGASRALLLCSGSDPDQVTLRLRPHAGRGVVLVAISELTEGAGRRNLHPEFPRHDLAPPPGPAPAKPQAAVRRELSTERMVMLPLSRTGCQRVEVAPYSPLLGYRVSAYDGEGRLIGEHEGRTAAALYLCLPKSASGPGRMHLQALSRGGPLDVQSLPEEAPAGGALERAPLAASRLLGMASDLGVLTRVADIGQVSEHRIGPDELVRIPLAVPAERCLLVLGAAERTGPGLELGLVDAETARFVDVSRGLHTAWVRTCAASGQTEQIVVELRAPHGTTTALLATRQETLTPRSAALLR